MTTAIVVHKVADYDAWRARYDAFEDERQASGVTDQEVYRAQDDPGLVIVRHDFSDRAAADAFFSSTELQQAMGEAGVDPSSVQIHFADKA